MVSHLLITSQLHILGNPPAHIHGEISRCLLSLMLLSSLLLYTIHTYKYRIYLVAVVVALFKQLAHVVHFCLFLICSVFPFLRAMVFALLLCVPIDNAPPLHYPVPVHACARALLLDPFRCVAGSITIITTARQSAMSDTR